MESLELGTSFCLKYIGTFGTFCRWFSQRSVSGEYDLKHLGKGVVLNHASLLFSHSVERGLCLKFQVPGV